MADFVRMYVQDCEIERDDAHKIIYMIPPPDPSVIGRFPHNAYHKAAEQYLAWDDDIGASRIGMWELWGRRWYISDDPHPTTPLVTNVSL